LTGILLRAVYDLLRGKAGKGSKKRMEEMTTVEEKGIDDAVGRPWE
jgi:hypothetical protein